MFTGLIETVGTLQSITAKNDYKVFQIQSVQGGNLYSEIPAPEKAADY